MRISEFDFFFGEGGGGLGGKRKEKDKQFPRRGIRGMLMMDE